MLNMPCYSGNFNFNYFNYSTCLAIVVTSTTQHAIVVASTTQHALPCYSVNFNYSTRIVVASTTQHALL